MDNRYYKYNCPALMNDGRFLTSYVRGRVFDQYIRNVNNINTGNDYKNYLQENGDSILNNLKAFYRQAETCKVEGQCLPMSGPRQDNMNDYLNASSQEPTSEWYDQVQSNSNGESAESAESANVFQEQADTKTYDILNAKNADKLSKQIYNDMLVQNEQNNLSAEKNCSFCKK